MAGYYEVIVRAREHQLIPYINGFAAGKDVEGVYVAQEAGLHLRALRERIKYKGEVHHIICAASSLPALREAVKEAPAEYKLEILEESKLERAEVTFAFKTPSRDIAKQIRKVLDHLPAGVSTIDYEPKEIVDPGARGAEVYSPAHDYTFSGKGSLEGDVGGVIETRRKLDEIDFVDTGEIELHR